MGSSFKQTHEHHSKRNSNLSGCREKNRLACFREADASGALNSVSGVRWGEENNWLRGKNKSQLFTARV